MKLKDRIVEIAYDLFSTNGYEQTSIENILTAVGCSKGGFYHHFKSKEEIMMVVVNNSVVALESAITTPLNKSALVLFNEVFESIFNYKINKFKEEPTITKVFDYSENDKILLSLSRKTDDIIYQRYLTLIEYGLSEGLVSVRNTQLIARLFTRDTLWLIEELNKSVMDKDKETYINELIKMIEDTFNRELDLSPTTLSIEKSAKAYLHAVRELF